MQRITQSLRSVPMARPGMPRPALLGSQRPLSHENVDGIPPGQLHAVVGPEVRQCPSSTWCVRAGAAQFASAGGAAMFYEYASISKSAWLAGHSNKLEILAWWWVGCSDVTQMLCGRSCQDEAISRCVWMCTWCIPFHNQGARVPRYTMILPRLLQSGMESVVRDVGSTTVNGGG